MRDFKKIFEIPEKALFVMNEDWRKKVLYGGRGSGKSQTLARCAIGKALLGKKRILCTRQYQVSIRESIHRLLSSIIGKEGLTPFFTITRDSIFCIPTQSEFIFRGVQNNPDEIKSTEDIDICLVEEAQHVSRASWDILLPTVRNEGSEFWICFNPDRPDDATYRSFITDQTPDTKAVELNYFDNPWFPQTLRSEMELCRSSDYAQYEHIWLGKPRITTDAQVFNGKFEVAYFDEPPEDTVFYFGADWGFAKDPTTLVRCFIRDQVLYVDYEAYGVGVETVRIKDLFDTVPDVRRHLIRADNARPETISHVLNDGFKIEAAEKWSGSVEDGIEAMRSFKRIVIHPRCIHTADEFKFYSYKIDKVTGDILPKIVDKYNHCIDAIRYALALIIKKRAEVDWQQVLNSLA